MKKFKNILGIGLFIGLISMLSTSAFASSLWISFNIKNETAYPVSVKTLWNGGTETINAGQNAYFQRTIGRGASNKGTYQSSVSFIQGQQDVCGFSTWITADYHLEGLIRFDKDSVRHSGRVEGNPNSTTCSMNWGTPSDVHAVFNIVLKPE